MLHWTERLTFHREIRLYPVFTSGFCARLWNGCGLLRVQTLTPTSFCFAILTHQFAGWKPSPLSRHLFLNISIIGSSCIHLSVDALWYEVAGCRGTETFLLQVPSLLNSSFFLLLVSIILFHLAPFVFFVHLASKEQADIHIALIWIVFTQLFFNHFKEEYLT